jgi:uncharacterized phage protein gp47/JayE
MPDYGLLSTGFSAKPLLTIKSELEAELKAAFGASIKVTPQSVFGKLIGILADRESELWDLAQAVYNATDPDKATGAALEALCALTGTIREGATPSTATLACVGTAGTVLPVGRVVSVSGSGGARFESTEAATLTAVSAWTAATAYAVGAKVRNNSNVYQCTVAGTSAGSGGPTTTANSITDNTVTWTYLGTGTGCADVGFEAEETGPTVATARTLTSIETPVSGWASAINVEDADLGQDIETDAALRVRREDEISAGGNATVNAIRNAVLDVDDVEACVVFVNDTDTTDGDGVPPHAVEILVQGGEDADILQAVFDSVAAGIATHGTESGSVEDDSGNSHTVEFSRPSEQDVYIIANVTKDPDDFPSDGEDQIKAALVEYGDSLEIGHNVVSSRLKAAIFDVDGVTDVTSCYIGLAPAPAVETTISITSRQRAAFDTSRITVNLSNEEL